MTELRDQSDVALDVLERGTDRLCGEGCGRRARVELDGADAGVEGYTFCSDCLHHLVQLGRLFADAVNDADDHLRAVVR